MNYSIAALAMMAASLSPGAPMGSPLPSRLARAMSPPPVLSEEEKAGLEINVAKAQAKRDRKAKLRLERK